MSHTLFPGKGGTLQAQCDTVASFKQSLMETGGDPQRSQFPHRPRYPLSSFRLFKKERPGTKSKEKPGSNQGGSEEGSQGRKAARRASYRESLYCREQVMALLGTVESSGVGGTHDRKEETGSFRYWLLVDIRERLLLGAIPTLELPACHQEVDREGSHTKIRCWQLKDISVHWGNGGSGNKGRL